MKRLMQKLRWLWSHPEVTWSGTGVYIVSLIVSVVVAIASWYFCPEESPTSVQKSNISVTDDNSGMAVIAGGNVTVNNPNASPDLLAKYAEELGATKQLINSFFGTLLEQKIPRDQWDAKLCEIADTHKELLARLATVQSEDPEVQRLKREAGQAIEGSDYAKAEDLLNQAEARDIQAIETLDKQAEQIMQARRQRHLSAAATNADQAKLQEVQLRYAKAAGYWQKAVALLPNDEKKDRSLYLSNAGYDLYRIAEYSKALPLFEQSLDIDRELGDQIGEGTTLSYIGNVHRVWGDYDKALLYSKQSLAIAREIESKEEEGLPMISIGLIYNAQGDYEKALPLFEQSHSLYQEIGDQAGEASTLNNIGNVYYMRYDYTTALVLFEQALAIYQKIGDRAGEGAILNNISHIHYARDDYTTALALAKQALSIHRKTDARDHEGISLNDIGLIYYALGDHSIALKYLEQSLIVIQKISIKAEEAGARWNIGYLYRDQNNLRKAEQYISSAVEMAEEIGHPSLAEWRKALEELRAEIKGR